MVVAVGFTVVEPLVDVEVKFPGVMAMLVAPVTAQLSVALAPELMVAGLVVKEVMEGGEPDPEEEFGMVEPQPARPRQAHRIRASEERLVVRRTGPGWCDDGSISSP